MIVLGHYQEIYNNSNYPSIKSDINKPTAYTKKIVDYMKKCKVSSDSPSIVTDVFTGKPINVTLSCMNDGQYAWRSDLIYYIENYNLRLPDDFINHVLSQINS